VHRAEKKGEYKKKVPLGEANREKTLIFIRKLGTGVSKNLGAS
jgi:hypothetical protein